MWKKKKKKRKNQSQKKKKKLHFSLSRQVSHSHENCVTFLWCLFFVMVSFSVFEIHKGPAGSVGLILWAQLAKKKNVKKIKKNTEFEQCMPMCASPNIFCMSRHHHIYLHHAICQSIKPDSGAMTLARPLVITASSPGRRQEWLKVLFFYAL